MKIIREKNLALSEDLIKFEETLIEVSLVSLLKQNNRN